MVIRASQALIQDSLEMGHCILPLHVAYIHNAQHPAPCAQTQLKATVVVQWVAPEGKRASDLGLVVSGSSCVWTRTSVCSVCSHC